ncbi:trypsin domain-containing protein [Phthorimaea operculella]|nr:trypsin domain-containing protein [Phthorimaea operculella]
MEGKIVGGNFTTIAAFPHSVAMFVHPIESHYCGGSVLNQKIILTAAHCTPGRLKKGSILYIMAGDESILKMDTLRQVKHFTRHKDYDKETVANDISLLYLLEDLELGPRIQRVSIRSEFPLDVQTAQVAGWGWESDTAQKMSLFLKSASQPIIPLEKCWNTYHGTWLPGVMCGGNPDSLTNRPAKGDSGSALVALGYLQIGLVSFRSFAYEGITFYTNVSYFYDWIAIQTIANECGNFNFTSDFERHDNPTEINTEEQQTLAAEENEKPCKETNAKSSTEEKTLVF